jgi:predicted DNA-binding protein (UPF0251 family)
MAKVGRKPIEIDIKQVKALASQQLSDQDIFTILHISKDTFYKRKKQLKEFSDALAEGRAIGIANITNKAYQKAMAGDGEMIRFILERKAGWKKEDRVNVGGKIEQDHEHKHTHEFVVGPAVQDFLAEVGLITNGAGQDDSPAGGSEA